jgi:hypothetical protein
VHPDDNAGPDALSSGLRSGRPPPRAAPFRKRVVSLGVALRLRRQPPFGWPVRSCDFSRRGAQPHARRILIGAASDGLIRYEIDPAVSLKLPQKCLLRQFADGDVEHRRSSRASSAKRKASVDDWIGRRRLFGQSQPSLFISLRTDAARRAASTHVGPRGDTAPADDV